MSRWAVRVWGGAVAETTSLAAADAVERLYRAAWDRGERPRTDVITLEIPKWEYAQNYYPPIEPMTAEKWREIRREQIARGPDQHTCAYCGDEHRSDKCPNVPHPEERVW